MYGTIARISIIPGREAALDEFERNWVRDHGQRAQGFIADYILAPDGRPHERLALTIFDSEASYRRNAEDPAQHAWYLQFRAFLTADPEWNDGPIDERVLASVPL